MGAQRTSQAIGALEDHIAGISHTEQPASLAGTLALISIAQSLDTLSEIGADIAANLNRLTGIIERR